MGRAKGKPHKEFSPQLSKNIEIKPVDWLKPYERNARTHSETQLDELAASIAEFGFTNPILAGADGTIIAGHGRLEAAKTRLDLKEVPVVILDYLTDAQRRAYIIADNKLALNAGWDENVLAAELGRLEADGFDLSLTGFDEIELSDVLAETVGIDDDEDENEGGDPGEYERPEKPVSKKGDLWILGNHRLICGDSRDEETLRSLMGDDRADLVHTDPPYNVDYSNADRPKAGKKDHGKIENDKLPDKDFYNLLQSAFRNAFDFSRPDASAYIWHSDKEAHVFRQAAIDAGYDYQQKIIWRKPMLLSRQYYQWAHEPCFFMIKGKPYFTDDRTVTTVWDFGGYDKSNNEHPTQKPTVVPEEAIKHSSRKKDVVLDIFGGAGGTLLACENLHRYCRMVEIDPVFCDVIVSRWQAQTKLKATLFSSGKTFAAVKAQRNNGKEKTE